MCVCVVRVCAWRALARDVCMCVCVCVEPWTIVCVHETFANGWCLQTYPLINHIVHLFVCLSVHPVIHSLPLGRDTLPIGKVTPIPLVLSSSDVIPAWSTLSHREYFGLVSCNVACSLVLHKRTPLFLDEYCIDSRRALAKERLRRLVC